MKGKEVTETSSRHHDPGIKSAQLAPLTVGVQGGLAVGLSVPSYLESLRIRRDWLVGQLSDVNDAIKAIEVGAVLEALAKVRW